MARKSARKPGFSRIQVPQGVKKYEKQTNARKNRRKLHQSDPQEHVDKPLNSRNID